MRQNHREIRWIVEGFTPETIPFSRLTEYLSELANLFGDASSMRFVRLEDNCVAVVNKIVEPGAYSRIEKRLKTANSEHGESAPRNSFERINRMLVEDGTSARIKSGSATILRFPGQTVDALDEFEMEGVATATGYLYYLVENERGQLNVRIRQHGLPAAKCIAPAHLQPLLKEQLFKEVRLKGRGTWRRTHDGQWVLLNLEAVACEPVENVTFRQAINELRSIQSSWEDDSLVSESAGDASQ
ncbi:MAG: hypothetical protein CMK07_04970 [Ponticaulis sp.]|nr:hypothetical protein [Ponticaulis sp.]